MARVKLKSVYERIEDKKREINECQNTLNNLNEELNSLYKEQDDLEMHQLLAQMKNNNLNISKALELLQNK